MQAIPLLLFLGAGSATASDYQRVIGLAQQAAAPASPLSPTGDCQDLSGQWSGTCAETHDGEVHSVPSTLTIVQSGCSNVSAGGLPMSPGAISSTSSTEMEDGETWSISGFTLADWTTPHQLQAVTSFGVRRLEAPASAHHVIGTIDTTYSLANGVLQVERTAQLHAGADPGEASFSSSCTYQ